MPHNSIKMLLISSGEQLEALLLEQLAQTGLPAPRLSRIADLQAAKHHLNANACDIVVMGSETEFSQRLDFLKSYCDPIPVLVFLHKDEPAMQLLAVQAGATDCLALPLLSPPLIERMILYAIRHKADESRLLRLAHFDPLTGVANRRLFESRLEECIAQARRADQIMALMLIDLDNFKTINDSLGHDAGDELLAQMAERLQNCIRETDSVARLGGDEFAVIATQITRETDVAQLAHSIIKACHFSIGSELDTHSIGCSIGIALYPVDSCDSSQLIQQADQALLLAKQQGRSRFLFADERLNLLTLERKQLTIDIEQAINHQQLVLQYQPIVSATDHRLCGTEALLRWQHPQRGILYPGSFMPYLDNNQLINAIGNWVLKNICEQQRLWQAAGLPALGIAINLSACQLEKGNFAHSIRQLIERQGLKPENLSIELKESDIFECSSQVIEQLYEIHDLGVRIVIDNFGKHYCSLTKLQRLPIDAIKIDRSLIKHIVQDADYAAVTEAIIQLCRVMDIDVIAQGVEDSKSAQQLSNQHCDQIQGFGISEPINGALFANWYKCRYVASGTDAMH